MIVWSLLLLASPLLAADPFAGISESTAAVEAPRTPWWREGLGFRREIMSEGAAGGRERAASRQSLGFELQEKLSTETETKASLDFQGRLVRRDRFVPVQNDMMGARRAGWSTEHHNAYADLYHLWGEPGRVNARAGHFYVPFGLNLQTDTHGTLLQLSNERGFGFERDWYGGLWGALNDAVNYDAYYLAGSGYDLKWRGQSGLGAARLSLGNKSSYERGLEGGLSYLGGERLDPDSGVVATQRAGVDGRWRRAVPTGLATLTTELSGGADAPRAVFTQLHQAEYLHSSRRFGLAAQYRRFWTDGLGADASAIGEVTWYFRNDVAGSSLHWLKLNVERRVEVSRERRDTIVALQYYRYW